MILVSVHPGISVDAVRQETGWPLRVAATLEQTPAPTQIELEMLQQFDPNGYWTGS